MTPSSGIWKKYSSFSQSNIIQKIPFSIVVEAEEITQESICCVDAFISDVEITMQEDRIICDMEI